jgi:hypothetical protein
LQTCFFCPFRCAAARGSRATHQAHD